MDLLGLADQHRSRRPHRAPGRSRVRCALLSKRVEPGATGAEPVVDLDVSLRPKLRIHDPEEEARDLSKKVDQILEKISQQGEASLTKQERKTLEEASRRYQRRRE